MASGSWLPIPIAVVGLLVLLAVSIAVPLFLLNSSDANTEAIETQNAAETAQELANLIGPTLEFVHVTLLGLQGFVAASFKTLPNISLPPAQRIQMIPLFSQFAASLIPSNVLDIGPNNAGFTFELHPGGVLTQMYPPNTTATSQAVDDFVVDNSSTWEYINDNGTGNVLVVETVVLPDGNSTIAVEGGIAVFGSSANLSSWWGNIVVTLRMDLLVDSLHVADVLDQKGYFWCLVTDEAVPRWVDGSASTSHDSMPGEGPTTTMPIGTTPGFVLQMRSKVVNRSATPTNVTLVIIFGTFASLFAIAFINFVVFMFSLEYTGRDHAPKYAPFALTVVAIDHGEDLCRVLPSDAGTEMIDEFNKRVQKVLKNHRAFLSQSLLRHCHVIVTRSIDASVHLSYELIEGLRDDPMWVTLPNGTRIQIRALVSCHWCEDATPVDEDLNFEGFDVLYAIKFFRSAAIPDRVVASRSAKELARSMATVHVVDHGFVVLRDILEEQECFVLFDPKSKQLRAALDEPVESSTLVALIPFGGRISNGTPIDFGASGSVQDANVRNSKSQSQSGTAANLNKKSDLIGQATNLSAGVEAGLKRAFSGPSELLDIEFDEVRVTLSIIFSALSILFDSFAASERPNILRRLATVNGLPVGPQLLDELSVRCLLQSKLVFNQRLGGQTP